MEEIILKYILKKYDEVTGDWRKVLRILYSFLNIIRQIKSRRMR
jgi:hypothetical protein